METEECENDNEHKRATDRSPSPGVKSTAVVKYTAFQSPVGYARLQCNTDLNLPPSNWGSIDSYGLKQILTRGTGLSSFRMAHMFPDCVGEVDVISDAECIKKLLKLPYHSNGTVSMMVHRVENTLLLDDFDVYDYLMKSEWSWLKDFFYDNILKTMSEKERMSLTPMPSPSVLQLTHKFLSHSVAQPPPLAAPALPNRPMCLTGPFLPEPETRPEEPPNEHHYNRNVLWTFEDIHMLIGSDLPIFGDKDRPCVSLRLRDAREPINVLTGIDYWLDNLMCNVPEVLMCYHLDGIVQKYEPMKTEDLPNMENSRFSPKVIRNVAQNILSFLKSNVTKAGHTYWLFKGPHDDVVKLYDLTSLCPDSLDNPFTTPVAMLLYRVARNMRLMNRTKHVKHLLEHVVELLKVERYPQIVASSHYMLSDLYVPATTNPACPDFKDETSDSDEESDFGNYAEFAREFASDRDSTSCDKDSNTAGDKDDASDRVEIMSDCTEKEDPCDKEVTDPEVDEGVCEGESDGEANKCERDGDRSLALQIRGLTLKYTEERARFHTTDEKSKSERGKSLGADPPERCGRALRHALKGLQALHHLTIQKSKEEERERLKQQIIIEEQHPKMANPYEPIKMDYEPLSRRKDPKEHVSRSRRRKRERKTEKSTDFLIESKSNIDKNAILIRKENNALPSWHEPNRDDNFAWKLHLKTLLYEKICLAYATLAEYSYANEQYGFSIKYISMASKCQKLLSNMIIKSRVVDASCLIGRVGDNFFQLSKHWVSLDKFKKQFETDHEIDSQIKVEIENDFAEEIDGDAGDEFDLDISLPTSETDAMLSACAYYRRAERVAGAQHKRDELLRRLASVANELAVRHMNDAQQIYNEYSETEDESEAAVLLQQFKSLARKAADCLDEAATIFQRVHDVPNLALLYCNKARYMRFKAHCNPGGFSSEKRSLYSQAEDLYTSALKLLGPRESCGAASIRDLVGWELSCHVYTRAVLMQDCPGASANEVTEVAEAFKHALKFCPVSPGPRQYLYQFRAAMINHRLGSLYHSQYRLTTEEGPRRRALLGALCGQYERAARQFAALEDAAMFLTARLEHVAALEAHALGAYPAGPVWSVRSVRAGSQAASTSGRRGSSRRSRTPPCSSRRASSTSPRSRRTLWVRTPRAPCGACAVSARGRRRPVRAGGAAVRGARGRRHVPHGAPRARRRARGARSGCVPRGPRVERAQCPRGVAGGQYERAARQFAALEDAAMFLTARLEHVAALEVHALGAYPAGPVWSVRSVRAGSQAASTSGRRGSSRRSRTPPCSSRRASSTSPRSRRTLWVRTPRAPCGACAVSARGRRRPVRAGGAAVRGARGRRHVPHGAPRARRRARGARSGCVPRGPRVERAQCPRGVAGGQYERAARQFAALEDAAMFLTARLEHVAALEAHALVCQNLKLKSLQTAIMLLRQSHSVMKLLKNRDPEDQKETSNPEDGEEKSMKNEHSLLCLYENRLHFILKSIIQYTRSKSNKDYEKMTDMYKKLYCASLRIQKNEDLKLFAGSICEVLEAMDEIDKEFE
ncbi:erythroid differentiation-related factor 1 isoform X2 [Epargyreus clarus]|uniref:erythroid differentiation-related factor 1 isoform X2 n=1 Tax=Epargyreus clarus TaxID=520877 RepID=UPI003C2DB4FB